jgi:hypothetical protein
MPRLTHATKLPEYAIWEGMIGRCYYPQHSAFKYYGGRGIIVCKSWRHSFQTFYNDKGPRPSPQHTLDRFPNPDGNYSPRNTRWATRSEQMRNTRANHLVTYNGQTLCIAEWAEILGIGYDTLQGRLEVWTVERAFTESVQLQERTHLIQGKYLLTHNSITQSLSEWAKELGIDTHSLKYRLKHWGLEKALTKPARRH